MTTGNEGDVSPEVLEALEKAAEQAADANRVNEASALLTQIRQAAEEVESQRAETARAVEAAQLLLLEIKALSAHVGAVRTQVDENGETAAGSTAQIEQSQIEAGKAKAGLESLLANLTAEVSKVDALKLRAQAAADSVVKLEAQVQATSNQVEQLAESTGEMAEAVEGHGKQTGKLAGKAATIESSVEAYEKQLAGLLTSAQAQLDRINGLLPGATSAGLATAFRDRAQSFEAPRKRWERIFVLSILGLVVIGATGAWHVLVYGDKLTYDDILRLWLGRIPLAAAILWLTLHASREAALANRLEEDYAYKAAVASSFEGFRHQMTEIPIQDDVQPLAKLCVDTLAAIAQPPGRIYDKHKLTVTPTQEIVELTAAAAALLIKKKPDTEKEE